MNILGEDRGRKKIDTKLVVAEDINTNSCDNWILKIFLQILMCLERDIT